jgi:hypothetical protein
MHFMTRLLSMTLRCGCKRTPTSDGSSSGKASFRRRRADQPVRRVDRCRAQRPLDHGSNLIVVDCSRSVGASLVKQTIVAILQKSATPLANCVFVGAELGSHTL